MPANKRPLRKHFGVQFADETVIGQSIEPPAPVFPAAARAIMIRADWSPFGGSVPRRIAPKLASFLRPACRLRVRHCDPDRWRTGARQAEKDGQHLAGIAKPSQVSPWAISIASKALSANKR